jgi:hypothetical protein
MNNMLNSKTMDAIIDTFKALKEYIDYSNCVEYREKKSKKFDKQLTKLEKMLYSDKE